MAGGYRAPAEGLEVFRSMIDDIRRRLAELERPTGTSITGLVAQVQAALANLAAQVEAQITAQSYTRSQIDAKVAAPGDITPSAVTASGIGRFNAGLKSTDVHSRSLAYGGAYTETYAHADGTLGTVASSQRFKQDVAPAEFDVAALERAEVVRFRYREAVDNIGDDAPVILGGIAEQFAACGLGDAVTLDEYGEPFSIESRALVFALLSGYQAQAKRLAEVEHQLASLSSALASLR